MIELTLSIMICYEVSKRVMISAGEASGELYGALLSRAIWKMWPDVEIIGIGGTRMKTEGVRLIASISSSFGLVETVQHWRQVIGDFKKAARTLVSERPDILVLIDFPDFNMSLAKKAKSAGIPVLYYVSPQVWAWRKGRVKKLAFLVDRMAVLFPFEVDIYKDTGLNCEFVGHPISETMNVNQTKEELKRKLGLDPLKQVIALLPGSRPSEIKRHEPLIGKTAEMIHAEFPDMQIIIPLVSGTRLKDAQPAYARVIYDRTSEVTACSDAAAVASGTATLETALSGTPMVVFYKLSPLTFMLGKLLVKVRFISLVNLLSDKGVVVELIQKNASAENIFLELKKILSDSVYRQDMITNLLKIRSSMEEKKPSTRVALMAGKLAGWDSINA